MPIVAPCPREQEAAFGCSSGVFRYRKGKGKPQKNVSLVNLTAWAFGCEKVEGDLLGRADLEEVVVKDVRDRCGQF